MFSFIKKKKDILKILSDQAIGGQSVLFRIFKEVIKEDEKNIHKLELTYFALSTVGYFYLRISKSNMKEEKYDQVSFFMLEKSLEYSGEDSSLKNIVREFQKRYGEYNKLINSAFIKGSIDSHACSTLLMHIYECVTKKPSKDKMIEITIASSLILEYLLDHIDFINQKVDK